MVAASNDSKPKSKHPRAARLLGWLLAFALILLLSLLCRYAVWVGRVNESLDALEQGKLTKARDLARESIALMSFLPDNKSFALSLRLLTDVYACRRQFQQAELYELRLLDFDKKIWGESSPEYAGDLGDLALMKRKTQNFAEAERLYKKVIALFDLRPGHEIESARNKALLAWVLIQQNKLDEAKQMIAESDQVLVKAFGKDHFERAVGLVENAVISRKEGKLEEFKRDRDLVFDIATKPKRLEKSSAQTVVVLNLLAQMYAEEIKPENPLKEDGNDNAQKAVTLFEIAESNCKASAFGGGYNMFMADILEPHAKLLSKLGKHNDAELLKRRAQQIRSLELK